MVNRLSPEKRVNPKKEFFNITTDDALSILIEVSELLDDAEIIIYNGNKQNKSITKSEIINFGPPEFSSIKREHIIFASNFIDKYGVPKKFSSVTRDVIVGVKKYPPKYVMAVAYFHANGVAESEIALKIQEQRILNRFSFNTVSTFPIYERLGFTVENKEID